MSVLCKKKQVYDMRAAVDKLHFLWVRPRTTSFDEDLGTNETVGPLVEWAISSLMNSFPVFVHVSTTFERKEGFCDLVLNSA